MTCGASMRIMIDGGGGPIQLYLGCTVEVEHRVHQSLRTGLVYQWSEGGF